VIETSATATSAKQGLIIEIPEGETR